MSTNSPKPSHTFVCGPTRVVGYKLSLFLSNSLKQQSELKFSEKYF